ncbi:hypothetical protein [Kaarinaea lacus]
MMRQSLIVFVVLMVVMTTAEAGRIYGSLQIDGQAVAKGTQVVINCSGKPYQSNVQNHGRYSVNVDRQGACTFSVAGFKGASIDVNSYAEATRYNFIIKRSGNRYSIQRI